MSIADDYANYGAWFPREENDEQIKNMEEDARNGIWVIKNGDELLIKNMETSHIYNCINMLKRNGYEGLCIDVFEQELDKRNKKPLDNVKIK
jgi:hypothetical protein